MMMIIIINPRTRSVPWAKDDLEIIQMKKRAGAGGVSGESIDAAEAASRSCVAQKGKETPSWASPISSSVVDGTD